MEIFRVYSDLGFTGANLNRPALFNLLNDIRENKIDIVVSYKIPTSTDRENRCECIGWLPSSDSLQTIKIVLPNIIHGCKKKNLRMKQ